MKVKPTLVIREFVETLPGQQTAKLDFEPVRVKVLKLEKGADLPPHSHAVGALHILTKGKLELISDDGSKLMLMPSDPDYKCGAWEYRIVVLEDSELVVIEPNA